MLPALLWNEVRLVHAFFQMLLIELMHVLVVRPGLLIRNGSLLLKYPVALHCVSLVDNALLQYRKRAPKVRVLTSCHLGWSSRLTKTDPAH
jgi:hypothetical protein